MYICFKIKNRKYLEILKSMSSMGLKKKSNVSCRVLELPIIYFLFYPPISELITSSTSNVISTDPKGWIKWSVLLFKSFWILPDGNKWVPLYWLSLVPKSVGARNKCLQTATIVVHFYWIVSTWKSCRIQI